MYEAREQEDILAELQSYSKTPASKFEGTFEYDMLASNALEFAKVEIELEQAYKAAFAETSWGEYLTMRAAEFGVDRKQAVQATGEITLTGNGTVSAGSRFSTLGGIIFETTKDAVIQEKGNVAIRAVLLGPSGNVAANTIINIPVSIPGITSVTNEDATHGGYDEESDEELLKRFYVVVRTPATSGNKYHYYNWAMAISGVGNCKVLPLWNGPGTVKVIIVDADNQTASQELIDAVAADIEEKRPIGAAVTVASPEPLKINITADIKGSFDTEAFKTAMTAYFVKRVFSLNYLSQAQITDKIMDQSTVEDCDNVLLNGKKRVDIGDEYLPIIGEVTIHDISA